MKGVSTLPELKKKALWISEFFSLYMELGKSQEEIFEYEQQKKKNKYRTDEN